MVEGAAVLQCSEVKATQCDFNLCPCIADHPNRKADWLCAKKKGEKSAKINTYISYQGHLFKHAKICSSTVGWDL